MFDKIKQLLTNDKANESKTSKEPAMTLEETTYLIEYKIKHLSMFANLKDSGNIVDITKDITTGNVVIKFSKNVLPLELNDTIETGNFETDDNVYTKVKYINGRLIGVWSNVADKLVDSFPERALEALYRNDIIKSTLENNTIHISMKHTGIEENNGRHAMFHSSYPRYHFTVYVTNLVTLGSDKDVITKTYNINISTRNLISPEKYTTIEYSILPYVEALNAYVKQHPETCN